jgi:hypothetical protein
MLQLYSCCEIKDLLEINKHGPQESFSSSVISSQKSQFNATGVVFYLLSFFVGAIFSLCLIHQTYQIFKYVFVQFSVVLQPSKNNFATTKKNMVLKKGKQSINPFIIMKNYSRSVISHSKYEQSCYTSKNINIIIEIQQIRYVTMQNHKNERGPGGHGLQMFGLCSNRRKTKLIYLLT